MILKNKRTRETLEIEYSEFRKRIASRVRSAFAKRMKFFEAKTVDTFNANKSRQPRRSRHLKRRCLHLLFLCQGNGRGENGLLSSSEERAIGKQDF